MTDTRRSGRIVAGAAELGAKMLSNTRGTSCIRAEGAGGLTGGGRVGGSTMEGDGRIWRGEERGGRGGRRDHVRNFGGWTRDLFEKGGGREGGRSWRRRDHRLRRGEDGRRA